MRSAGKKREGESYQRYLFSGAEWLKYGIAAAVLGGVAVWLCYRSIFGIPAGILLAGVYLRQKKKELLLRKKQTLELHFRDFLTSLHATAEAGYSLENGVRFSAKEIEKRYGEKDVLSVELRGILRQMELQRPVETLFWELGIRSGLDSVLTFSEVMIIAKRIGGSMQKVLENSWRNLCAKIDTEQEVYTVTAAMRYEHMLMCLMPAGILLYMESAFGGFMDSLYGNTTGAVIMTVALGLYILAYLWGQRLIRLA